MKNLLQEYLAVRKEDEIIKVGKQIYSDLLPLIKSGQSLKKMSKTYYIYINEIKIPIIVTYPSNSQWCWYNEEKNNIEINVKQWWSFNTFLQLFLHEVTHAIDQNKGYNEKNGYDFDSETYSWSKGKLNVIDNINTLLYRLWDKRERTAYQTVSISDENYINRYINSLKDCINKLYKKSKYDENVWNYVMNNIPHVPKRYKNNWQHFKQYFIKKSEYLLDKYQKDTMKNTKYWQNNPISEVEPNENSPFLTKVQNNQDKEEINKKIRKLGYVIFNTMENYDTEIEKDQYENFYIREKTITIRGRQIKIRVKKDSHHETLEWFFPDFNNESINYWDLGFNDFYDAVEYEYNNAKLLKLGKFALKVFKANGVDISPFTIMKETTQNKKLIENVINTFLIQEFDNIR